MVESNESLRSEPRSAAPEIIEDIRLWGSQTQLTLNEATAVAFLKVDPGQALSEQSHKLRSEFWIVLIGEMNVELDGVVSRLSGFGAKIFIPVGAHHRAYGLDAALAHILKLHTASTTRKTLHAIRTCTTGPDSC